MKSLELSYRVCGKEFYKQKLIKLREQYLFMFHFRSPAKHTKAPRKYMFEKRKKWTHYDLTPGKGKFFVMTRHGKPLNVLQYDTVVRGDTKTIKITGIQRASKVRWRWLFSEEEGAETHNTDVLYAREQHRKTKDELGTHTSEFVLREFLFRNRDEILSGRMKIILEKPPGNAYYKLLYHKLGEWYFKKNKSGQYELHLGRRRTKDVLFKGLAK
jgi:hypothetical protein